MKYFVTLLAVLISMSSYSQKILKPQNRTKILLIPLDDRPPCLQFTQKLGLIARTQVVAPPKELLGNFTLPGKSDKIIDWLKKQDLKNYKAAIISLDMLAYGGLVASRIHNVSTDEALQRVEIIKMIHKMDPRLPVYGQSVIMRLAPTGDGKNEAYRAKLAEWAEISVDENSKAKTAQLENQIPASALLDYQLSRKRDLAVNLKAIDFVKDGFLDYLILSQDDAKPQGVHIADREKLVAEVKKLHLEKKIVIMPGTDEISMLLLSRSLNQYYHYCPRVKAIYSSQALSDQPMPFEDRPLKQTVSYDIEAAGGREVVNNDPADLYFYVFPSRFQSGKSQTFAHEIEKRVHAGEAVMVADIDAHGNVQGGDSAFTTDLLNMHLFPELYSYASWNTAGNTIGTSLPQGVIYALAKCKRSASQEDTRKVKAAEDWFTFHRVLDDYFYHNPIRAQAKIFIAAKGWDPNHLDRHTVSVENFCTNRLKKYFKELNETYHSEFNPSSLTFTLPWRRTFESEINFQTQAK